MGNLAGLVVVGGLLVAVVIVWVVQARIQRKRDEAFAAFSESHAFQYVSEAPNIDYPFAAFALFQEGHSHRFRHQMSGTISGHPFIALDFVYVTGYGRSSSSHTVAVMGWKDLTRLPDFTLAPESWYNRVAQRLGAFDIDFPGDPAFSNSYVLKTMGATEACGVVFTSDVRAFLTANPGQHIAGFGETLIWWRPGGLAPPPYTDPFLSDGSKIRSLFN